MFDTHMHTTPFSTDSSMLIEEVLRRQKELSVGVVLTEHMDYDFPPPDEYYFDPSEYFMQYQNFRSDRLLLGAEIGMQTQVLEQNRHFLQLAPFDMVIASVHAVSGWDLYYPEYYAQMADKNTAYRTYLLSVLENIRLFDDFDTLGHIDYICRKAPYKDSQLYYREFPDEIDAIIKTLIQKDKVMELNTRRLGTPASARALLPIYQRYHELGGRYVTLGSDAHTPAGIGAHLQTAAAFADSCGLTPVCFRERKMQSAV